MKTKLLPLLLFTFATNAFAALDTPTEDFTDNNDGTVTHKKTGLTWQRCSVGQTWNSGTSNCDGTTTVFNYADSINQTSNFAGYSDWRIPRIDEILSIVEYGTSPSINSVVFPNTPTGSYAPYRTLNYMFWTTTTASYRSSATYILNFTTGESFADDRVPILEPPNSINYNRSIRFVRGSHSLTSSGEFTPSADFIDNRNGTVTHKTTNLTWQRCSIGQTWDGSTCSGTPSKMTYNTGIGQNNTFAGYSDWRLPTVSELLSIVEYKVNNPSINNLIFSNSSSDIFGTSTQNFFNANNVWSVDFSMGSTYSVSSYPKTSNFAARLVRASTMSNTTPIATPTTIDLSTTLSQSSSRVKINENLIYTATVINNGTGTANNSLLKIYLPPRNVSVVSMPSDCVTTGKSITCSLGNLAAGANTSRAITVNYIKSGGASVSSLVLTDSNDTNSANNVSRVVTAIKK